MEAVIHRILQGSYANGPGIRNVVWFQGCPLNCPGCFNPETHDIQKGRRIRIEDLCEILTDPASPAEGVTISGGEPFLQTEALYALLRGLREHSVSSIIVFSGYTISDLRADPQKAECLELTDALICGPYRKDLPAAPERFCSSSNQELVLVSSRYTEADFRLLPLRETIITADGNVINSGIFS